MTEVEESKARLLELCSKERPLNAEQAAAAEKIKFVESLYQNIRAARIKGRTWGEIAKAIGWPDPSVKYPSAALLWNFVKENRGHALVRLVVES